MQAMPKYKSMTKVSLNICHQNNQEFKSRNHALQKRIRSVLRYDNVIAFCSVLLLVEIVLDFGILLGEEFLCFESCYAS